MSNGVFRTWKQAVYGGDLLTPMGIQRLFETAVNLGIVPSTDEFRAKVFTQAVIDCKLAQHPGALFINNVIKHHWNCRLQEVEIARRIMARADVEGGAA